MPLKNSSSNKARQANIATEISSGKNPKQAVAIGYAVQRRAKMKGYAEGGDVESMADDAVASTDNDNKVDKPSKLNSVLTSFGKGDETFSMPKIVTIPNVLQPPQQQFAKGGVTDDQAHIASPELWHDLHRRGVQKTFAPMLNSVANKFIGRAEDHSKMAVAPKDEIPSQFPQYDKIKYAEEGFARGGSVGEPDFSQMQTPDKIVTAHIGTPRIEPQARAKIGPIHIDSETVKGVRSEFAEGGPVRTVVPPLLARPETATLTKGGFERHAMSPEAQGLYNHANAHGANIGHDELQERTKEVLDRIPPNQSISDKGEREVMLARGGLVPPVPHHESASLRWPLSHLAERGRRQQSYALGLHLKHHFADGGQPGIDQISESPRAHTQEELIAQSPVMERELPEVSPQKSVAPKPEQVGDELRVAKPEMTPLAETKPLSTEEQIEKERQEERYAALHSSVIDSIRRHLANGLSGFGGGRVTDYNAEDQANARAVNENAQQRLNMLHAGQAQAHTLAEQSPDSARTFAVKRALSQVLNVPSEQFAGIAHEDLGSLAGAIQNVRNANSQDARTAATMALKQQMQELGAKQKDRELGISQQRADAASKTAGIRSQGQEARILAPVSRAMIAATADQRRNMDQLQKVDTNLERMQKSGVASNVDVAAMAADLAALMRNGSATEGEIQAVLPKSLQARLAGLVQYASGQTQDTGLAGMTVSQFGELARAVKQAVNKSYSRNVNNALGAFSHLEGKFPDEFKTWRAQAARGLPVSTYEGGPEEPGGNSQAVQDLYDQGVPVD